MDYGLDKKSNTLKTFNTITPTTTTITRSQKICLDRSVEILKIFESLDLSKFKFIDPLEFEKYI